MLGQRGLELGRDRAGQLAQVDLLGAQLERAGLQPGEVEQVDRELAQPLDLLGDLRRGSGAGCRASSSSSSSSSTKPPSEKIGVRSSCEAVAMNFLRAGSSCGELALHVVEGGGQLAELVARVDRDRLAEIAGGDPLGGVLQALDPRGQPARGQM